MDHFAFRNAEAEQAYRTTSKSPSLITPKGRRACSCCGVVRNPTQYASATATVCANCRRVR